MPIDQQLTRHLAYAVVLADLRQKVEAYKVAIEKLEELENGAKQKATLDGIGSAGIP